MPGLTVRRQDARPLSGNLVFAESNDGHIIALSADKGNKLWEFKLIPGLAKSHHLHD